MLNSELYLDYKLKADCWKRIIKVQIQFSGKRKDHMG